MTNHMRRFAITVMCLAGLLSCQKQKPASKEVSQAPTEYREPVSKAIDKGEVKLPDALAALADNSRIDDGDGLMLETPVSSFTSTATPTFRWGRLPRVEEFFVTIVDETGKKVAESGAVNAAEWQCKTPLTPGKSYKWSVMGKTARREIRSYSAKFAVPEQAVLARLADAKTKMGNNGIALAVIYAEAGAVDEAERLVAAAIVSDPSSEPAKRLYKTLRQFRVKMARAAK